MIEANRGPNCALLLPELGELTVQMLVL